MARTLLYRDGASRVIGDTGLPVISRDLDSVRSWGWELEFRGKIDDRILRLGAKQVSQSGYSVEDIEVKRVNDKVYYPGIATPEELTITFDFLLRDDVARSLYEWAQGTYNPITGVMGDSDLKIDRLSVMQLKGDMSLHSATNYLGVYVKSYKISEWNYQTNEMATLELILRYDFMEQEARA